MVECALVWDEGTEGKASLGIMGALDADRTSTMGFIISDAMVAVVTTDLV